MTTNKQISTLQREVTLANQVINELLKENHELKKTLETMMPSKEIVKSLYNNERMT